MWYTRPLEYILHHVGVQYPKRLLLIFKLGLAQVGFAQEGDDVVKSDVPSTPFIFRTISLTN